MAVLGELRALGLLLADVEQADTPGMRPMTRVAADMHAPVLPALKKPWALSSLTRRQPTTMLESFFLRTALAGCSPISMT